MEITSYPPAGNDVVEGKIVVNNLECDAYIKIERSKMANFIDEQEHLTILSNNYYQKIPKVYEYGTIDGKKYLVLEKIEGERLSDLLNEGNVSEKEKREYLIKYGEELAVIHSIPCHLFNLAKQRVINDYPKEDNYQKMDSFIQKYLCYLKENRPTFNNDTFIHGDFHYANILWENKKINGIIDFEYSGKGYKEQDIAWACILRSTQFFMDNIEDVQNFLEGYRKKGNYNPQNLKWCLINGYCHFYLMNMENEIYKEKIKKLLLEIDMKEDFFK